MVHIKKLNDFINESQTRVKVNGSTNGRNEYEVKIAQEFTGAEYLFTVYANDEAQAIDLVLDLVSKRYKELVANVPSDFSNDWGYDDEGGYTTYGDDSPYVFNSEGTIAVNADGFEITERRGRMSESRASRRGYRAINEAEEAIEDGKYDDGYEDFDLDPNKKYSLKDILRNQLDSYYDYNKYSMTVEGLVAVYETLPNHSDTTLFKECYDYAFTDISGLLPCSTDFVKWFFINKILEKINAEQFIEIVESGKFLKNTNRNVFYTMKNGEHFDNSQYKQWAEEIRNFVDFSK